MAKNYIESGDKISAAAPSGAVSGQGELLGASLIGVALSTPAATGDVISFGIEGVYELPKPTADVMAVGAKVNWDNTAKEFQLATSDLDGCGTVYEAAGSGILVVKVKLTQV